MIRKSLLILSITGLVVSAGLWVASYFYVQYRNKPLCITLRGGAIHWTHTDRTQIEHKLEQYIEQVRVDPSAVPDPEETIAHFTRQLDGKYFAAFGYDNLETWWWPEARTNPLFIVVPLWMPVALCGAAAIWAMLPIARRHRLIRLGRCAVCGYDLRSSSDACPECGHATETAL